MTTHSTGIPRERESQDILDKRKASGKYIGVFPFAFDDSVAQAIPDAIQLIPIGQWDHDLYGQILITASDIAEFVVNFDAKVRKGVYITAGHEGYEQELPAQGWVTAVEARADGLWGMVDWTELGKATLTDKQYKFISPEFYREYEDPQTHTLYRNVLIGAALTKSPYFKELQAVVFAEPKIKKLFTETMDINEITKKAVADLTDAEKAYLKEHKAELTDEQKASYTAVIDEVFEETPEAKKEREDKEKGDANEAAGLNRDGSAKTDLAVEASDKKLVQISASELAILRKKADEGAQAFAEAQKMKLDAAVGALTFSSKNKDGRFLPKDAGALRSFMQSLSVEQSSKFSELMGLLPKNGAAIFSETGLDSKATEGTAQAALDAKVNAKMSAEKMTYSDALKSVLSENPELETQYDSELTPVRGSK